MGITDKKGKKRGGLSDVERDIEKPGDPPRGKKGPEPINGKGGKKKKEVPAIGKRGPCLGGKGKGR